MLTQEEILEFKRIYEEEFGEIISYQEAHDRAIEVATYFEMIDDIRRSWSHSSGVEPSLSK